MLQRINIDYQPAKFYFKSVVDLPSAIWFDSAGSDRFDIICAQPICSINYVDNRLTLTANHPSYTAISGTFETTEPVALIRRVKQWLEPQDGDDDIPFWGGLAGSIDYDSFSISRSSYDEKLQKAQQAEFAMGLYCWALVVDNKLKKTTLIILPECPEVFAVAIVNRLKTQSAIDLQPFELMQPFTATTAKQEYIATVAKVLDYINSGDCYQVNYSQHFLSRFQGSPYNAYLLLRQQGAPFSAFIQHDKGAILSFSPERFIAVDGSSNRVETWPIKGTKARSSNPEVDRQNADELSNSLKDRAENLMIVDLLRNDLSINSKPHSVKVDKLFELQSYEYVHHLVSKISSELTEQSDALDLIVDAFPGGSITGAPKWRSMQIINQLERFPRHIYCGSIGYFSCCGNADSNIAIRTFLADNNRQLHCWGGGGIVADSSAEQEYQESLQKVLPMMYKLEQAFLIKH